MLCYGSYKYTKRCLVLRIYWEFRPSSVEPPANAFVLRGGAHGSVGLWVWGAGRITGAATHHLTTRLLKPSLTYKRAGPPPFLSGALRIRENLIRRPSLPSALGARRPQVAALRLPERTDFWLELPELPSGTKRIWDNPELIDSAFDR
ncbi:hypothetical protein GW17_00026734 [Ensete ventricosum]|nr:hypothetical protein GW17_00026734 [Ensete ventricosum]